MPEVRIQPGPGLRAAIDGELARRTTLGATPTDDDTEQATPDIIETAAPVRRQSASSFVPLPEIRRGSGLLEAFNDELARRAELGTPPTDDGIGYPPPHVDEAAAPGRRQKLLGDYQTAIQRPLDLEGALAAIKLRRAAEIFCKKNDWVRFSPRLPRLGKSRRRFDDLIRMPIDDLIADIEAHPATYTRTLLTDLAEAHLLAALNIDVELYKKGVHKAGLYEGLHSVAGRVTSVAAAAVSGGISHIPGTDHAVEAAKKAVKVISHELPQNIVNPFLTGSLRTITDVKESFKRVGGQPVVAPQIEASPDMGAIADLLKAQRQGLRNAVDRLRRAAASPDGDPQALGSLVDAFLLLHDTVDRQYKRRIGLNRTQTYSKGYGMAVNGIASAGSIITATVPVVGQIAGPVILGATVPMQWGAGYLDEKTKHRYNFRANTKWGDFLTDDAAHVHFKDLTIAHVSEAALRKSFITQPEVQIAAVREVYEDELGELMRKYVELEDDLETQEALGTADGALAPKRTRLTQLGEQIDRAKQHVGDFESLDAQRWNLIPADSTIGRCLDDLKALERADRRARQRKPGEVSQIVQRYAQAFHAGLATGTMLPIVDGITATDALYTHDHAGHEIALRPPAEVAAATTGTAGGVVFTATTGEVRMGKAKNKKSLSLPRATPEQFLADEARWTFQAGNRRVDLRGSAGYRRHVNSTWDEIKQIGRTLPHSLFGGPIGLAHLTRAKGELHQAKGTLRDALDALAATQPRPASQPAARAGTIAAMKDELYDYQAVRAHLGAGLPAA